MLIALSPVDSDIYKLFEWFTADNYGNTPLHCTCYCGHWGHFESAECLLNHHADPTIKSALRGSSIYSFFFCSVTYRGASCRR
jgi:ankyrin repeat protein